MPAILEKLKLLTAESDFSHHRAVGLALELIGDPAAARPLAELLAKPGMTGHAQTSIDVATAAKRRAGPTRSRPAASRSASCCSPGPSTAAATTRGVGKKILEAYTHDLRGHLARHAQAVLRAGSDFSSR